MQKKKKIPQQHGSKYIVNRTVVYSKELQQESRILPFLFLPQLGKQLKFPIALSVSVNEWESAQY